MSNAKHFDLPLSSGRILQTGSEQAGSEQQNQKVQILS
jgi:hypothetical protein